MPRRPNVRFFESRNAYYCQVKGKQHKLADGPDDFPCGSNYQAALHAFSQVMAIADVPHIRDANTVRAILDTYLKHLQTRVKPATLRCRFKAFQPFCKAHGETAVGTLTHYQVYQFLAQMRQPRTVGAWKFAWSEATVATFLNSVHAAFNWAVRSGLITRNPLVGIERPISRSRSRDRVLTPAQHQQILDACRSRRLERFRNLCIALENTGARPGELIAATAADWDDGLGALVYRAEQHRREGEFRHKAAGYGKDRIIRFTGPALVLMRQLVQERRRGPLLCTQQGKKYAESSFRNIFRRLGRQLGIPHLTAYSYRHTFATRWLLAGGSIDVLAELLGNTPAIIRKHYAHLCTDQAEIRRQLEVFKGVPAAETESDSTPPADGPRLHRA